MESTDRSYLYPGFTPTQTIPKDRTLSPGRVLFHLFLFGATCVTTALTGAAMSVRYEDPQSILGFFLGPHIAVIQAAAGGNFAPALNGVVFTFTLLIILGAHEFGHYFACRYYGIRATLPFFIPAPPYPLTPFGTFGAVIKIKDPIMSRRALFDIGIAGPLAGFVFALPASVIGLLITQPAIPPESGGIFYRDPPLFQIIIRLFGLPEFFEYNPVYWAAWGALLVTALNLFPVGQLDGGHVLYAVAGPRIHKWVSKGVSLAVASLAVASWVIHDSPIWFLWTIVLLFLTKVGHPPTASNEPLGTARIALAIVAFLVFALCFLPFPITMG